MTQPESSAPVPQGAHPHPIYVVTAPPSGVAVASLVFGIIGFLGGWCMMGIPCAIAVICGHAGLAETKNGARAGRGLAIAGLILGYLCLLPSLVLFGTVGIGVLFQ